VDGSAGDPLIRYAIFPVCAPALLQDRARPLRTLDDLRPHIGLDFRALVYGKPWFDWEEWLGAIRLPAFAPGGTRTSATTTGSCSRRSPARGSQFGKWPHGSRDLALGTLCAPLGEEGVAWHGAYYPITRSAAANRDIVAAFLDLLGDEVRADGALDIAPREVALPQKPVRANR
jgi:hypothetical protein